jgi:Uma2 family endonuclease
MRPEGREADVVSTPAALKTPPSDLVIRRRFTAQEFLKMGEFGILKEDDHVELILGDIIQMCAIGVLHVNCVNVLNKLLNRLIEQEEDVSIQNPILLRFDTQPEPDVVLLRATRNRASLPRADDVLFLIEVSDSSLDYDRETKLPLYAAAGIAEAWIIDLHGERLERHTEPSPDGYRRVVDVGRGERLSSATMPEVTLNVNAVLR